MTGDIPFLLIGGPYNFEVVKTGPETKAINMCDPQGIHGSKDMMYVYIPVYGTDEFRYSHTEEASYFGCR